LESAEREKLPPAIRFSIRQEIRVADTRVSEDELTGNLLISAIFADPGF
jgi:hypothetical protein